MLNNLLENAILYTSAQGLLQIRLWQSGTQLLLQVADSGIGIPPEQNARIFERFYRLNPNQGNGCGLGLAIVAEVAEHHNASINISAGLEHPLTHDTGSQFTVKFDCYDALPENSRPASTDPQ
jgi:two-component system, OmpR family, sensor histidine kinase TctE